MNCVVRMYHIIRSVYIILVFLRQSRGRLCLRHLLGRYGPHLDQGVQSGWTWLLLVWPREKGLVSRCQGDFRLGWVQRPRRPRVQVLSALRRRQREEGERCTGSHELAQQPCREEGNKAAFLRIAVETRIPSWETDKVLYTSAIVPDVLFFFPYRQWSALWTSNVSVTVSAARAASVPAG